MIKRALRGIFYDYIFLILSNIINLISIPFILQKVGKEVYGIQGTIFQVLSHFTLLDLGVGVYLINVYQVYTKKKENEKLQRILSTSFFLYVVLTLIIICIAVIFLFFFNNVVKIEEYTTDVKYTFIIASLWTALSLPFGIYNTILHAQQRLALVKSLLGMQSILNTLLIIAFLALNLNLISFGLAYSFSGIIIAFLCFYFVKIGPTIIRLKITYLDFSLFKDILKFAWEFGFAKIATLVKNNSDLIFISILFSVSNVTDFILNGKLFMLFIMFAQRVPLILLPGFGELYAESNYDKISKYYTLLSFYSIRFGILLGAIIFLTNEYFVTLWIGKGSYSGQYLNIAFYLFFIKEIYFNSIGFILYSYGELKNLNKISILEVVLKILFIYIASLFTGTESVLYAGIFSGLFSALIFYPRRICQSVNLSVTKYFKDSVLKPIFLSVPVLLIVFVISSIKVPLTEINTLVVIVVVITMLNILSFDFRYIKRKISSISNER